MKIVAVLLAAVSHAASLGNVGDTSLEASSNTPTVPQDSLGSVVVPFSDDKSSSSKLKIPLDKSKIENEWTIFRKVNPEVEFLTSSIGHVSGDIQHKHCWNLGFGSPKFKLCAVSSLVPLQSKDGYLNRDVRLYISPDILHLLPSSTTPVLQLELGSRTQQNIFADSVGSVVDESSDFGMLRLIDRAFRLHSNDKPSCLALPSVIKMVDWSETSHSQEASFRMVDRHMWDAYGFVVNDNSVVGEARERNTGQLMAASGTAFCVERVILFEDEEKELVSKQEMIKKVADDRAKHHQDELAKTLNFETEYMKTAAQKLKTVQKHEAETKSSQGSTKQSDEKILTKITDEKPNQTNISKDVSDTHKVKEDEEIDDEKEEGFEDDQQEDVLSFIQTSEMIDYPHVEHDPAKMEVTASLAPTSSPLHQALSEARRQGYILSRDHTNLSVGDTKIVVKKGSEKKTIPAEKFATMSFDAIKATLSIFDMNSEIDATESASKIVTAAVNPSSLGVDLSAAKNPILSASNGKVASITSSGGMILDPHGPDAGTVTDIGRRCLKFTFFHRDIRKSTFICGVRDVNVDTYYEWTRLKKKNGRVDLYEVLHEALSGGSNWITESQDVLKDLAIRGGETYDAYFPGGNGRNAAVSDSAVLINDDTQVAANSWSTAKKIQACVLLIIATAVGAILMSYGGALFGFGVGFSLINYFSNIGKNYIGASCIILGILVIIAQEILDHRKKKKHQESIRQFELNGAADLDDDELDDHADDNFQAPIDDDVEADAHHQPLNRNNHTSVRASVGAN